MNTFWVHRNWKWKKENATVKYIDEHCEEAVTLADAQATVEALQARVQELEALNAEVHSKIDRQDELIEELQFHSNQRTAELEALQRERDEAKEMQRSMYQGMANKLSELKPSHHPMYRAGVQEIIAAAFNGYQADKAQPVLLSEWQAQEICLAKLQAALTPAGGGQDEK